MWRKATKDDMVRGAVLRWENPENGFSDATIIATPGDSVRLARPMAHASAYFDDRAASVYCEVYEAPTAALIDRGVVVLCDRDGNVCTYAR